MRECESGETGSWRCDGGGGAGGGQVSYMILQRVSPVTHSIGNCLKRVIVIVASVIVFKNPMSRQNMLGAHARRPTCPPPPHLLPTSAARRTGTTDVAEYRRPGTRSTDFAPTLISSVVRSQAGGAW